MSNPFYHFSLPITFKIDLAQLEQAYHHSQLLTHPDRFIGKSTMEQRLAAERAMVLTNSYNMLKDPLLRAQVILSTKGIAIPGEHGTTIPQSPLLLDVLEWREAIDIARSRKTLEALDSELLQLYHKKCDDFDSMADEKLAAIYLELVYLHKTRHELSQKIKTLKE